MSTDHERLSATVTRRVQGVGFRHFTMTKARALGLRGWVRNEPGGAVQFVAEGAREELRTLLEAVQDGPRSARVRDVQAEWETAEGAFDGFGVRY